MINIFYLFFLLIIAMNSWAAGQKSIQFHIALKKDDPFHGLFYIHENTKKNIEILKSRFAEKNIKFEIIFESTVKNIISSLSNPNVAGVILAGHSRPVSKCINCDETGLPPENEKPQIETYNLNLLDSNKELLPKNIFTAAHPNLQFIAINSCHPDMIKKWYSPPIFKDISFITPKESEPTETLEEFEAINAVIGFNNVTSKIIELDQKEEFLYNVTDTPQEKIKVVIDHRDLLSSTYNYELLINNRLVGTFGANILVLGQTTIKKSKGTATIECSVPKDVKYNLRIQQNDANRKTVKYKFPVDNILIDKITVNNQTILNQSINIGDEDSTDSTTHLSHKLNLTDLEKLSPVKELRIENILSGGRP